MANSTSLKITAWVDDKASAPFKAIGQEAKRMSEGFQKSASLLRLVGDEAGKMGGAVGEVAGKVTGLAGIMGTAGPFGLALAGVTVAIGAGIAAYKMYTTEARLMARGTEAAMATLAAASARVNEHRAQYEALEQQIRNVGKSQSEIVVSGMKDEIARREFGLKLLEREIEERDAKVEAANRELASMRAWSEQMQGPEKDAWLAQRKRLQDVIGEEGNLLNIQRAGFTTSQQTVVQLYGKIDATERLDAAQRKANQATKHQAAAARDAAEAERELKKAADARAQRLEAAGIRGIKSATAEYTRKVEMDQKYAEYTAAEDQKVTDAKLANQQAVASAFGDAISQMIIANQTGSEEQKKAARAAALASIAAAGARAVVEAIASQAGIPIVGPALAAVAATAVGVLVAKYAKFAHGGTVTGGIRGRDSVPILAKPGEVVLTENAASELRSILGSNGPRPFSGGSGSGRGSGGGGSVTINQQSMVPPSSVQTRKAMRAAKRELATLSSRSRS